MKGATTAGPRGAYQGALQIIRFNWPFYAAGMLFTGAALFVMLQPWVSGPAVYALLAAAVITDYWLLASIAASHCIYDRSDIATGAWIDGLLPEDCAAIGNFHAGLDESSGFIVRSHPAARLRVFDFHDAAAMGARSIERARRLSAGIAEPAAFERLPPADHELDAEFVIFSAHELRRPEHRLAFFRELRRCLKPAGSLVVAEHLRDGWNFLAFGPGALHFLARGAWAAAFSGAGLAVRREFRITPFVTIFVLGGSP